jgi:hypothetical protein
VSCGCGLLGVARDGAEAQLGTSPNAECVSCGFGLWGVV